MRSASIIFSAGCRILARSNSGSRFAGKSSISPSGVDGDAADAFVPPFPRRISSASFPKLPPTGAREVAPFSKKRGAREPRNNPANPPTAPRPRRSSGVSPVAEPASAPTPPPAREEISSESAAPRRGRIRCPRTPRNDLASSGASGIRAPPTGMRWVINCNSSSSLTFGMFIAIHSARSVADIFSSMFRSATTSSPVSCPASRNAGLTGVAAPCRYGTTGY